MTNQEMLNNVNTALNILEGVRSQLLKDSKLTKKSKNKEALKDIKVDLDSKVLNNYKELFSSYDLPINNEFIASVDKIINRESITKQELIDALERIKAKRSRSEVNDLEKYVYGCLYKIRKS